MAKFAAECEIFMLSYLCKYAVCIEVSRSGNEPARQLSAWCSSIFPTLHIKKPGQVQQEASQLAFTLNTKKLARCNRWPVYKVSTLTPKNWLHPNRQSVYQLLLFKLIKKMGRSNRQPVYHLLHNTHNNWLRPHNWQGPLVSESIRLYPTHSNWLGPIFSQSISFYPLHLKMARSNSQPVHYLLPYTRINWLDQICSSLSVFTLHTQ